MPQGEIDKYTRYFHDTIFGRETLPAANHFDLSIASYYREISSGKFSFARAGLLGPLVAQVKGKPAGEVARLAIEAAGRQGAFAFKPFDSNHDGRIERDELAVLVIANATPPGRRWEDFSPPARNIAIEGEDVSFAGRAAVVAENDGFATVNRELFHVLAPDAADPSGSPQRCFALNSGLSLMAASNTANPGQTVHLDPWHKMLLGWTEPRVYSIGAPVKAKLAAQHVLPASDPESKRPVLLFDALKGPNEFFLLEYRTGTRLGFDQDLPTSGLVVWHVLLSRFNRPYTIEADRKNCRGETLPVISLFARGAPDWQLGGNRGYASSSGPFSLKWQDGNDTGVRVTVAPHHPADWRIEIAWTAPAAVPAGEPRLGAAPTTPEPQ